MGFMDQIGKLLGGTAGTLVKDVGDVADKFITTKEDKMRFQNELEALLQKRDSEIEQTIRAELGAKERVIVAELQQGDNFTKRARPSVVYFGLFLILCDFAARVAMALGASGDVDLSQMPSTFVPREFWMAWGGIVTTWVIGRSAEKRGTRNKVTDLINGTSGPKLLD